MEDLLELLNEFGGMLDARVFLGIASAVVVFAVEVKLFGGYRKSNRRKERAVARGHVVKAKLKSAWDDDTSGYSVDSWFHAAYVYVVDGVSYQYRYLGKVRPPSVLTLYYLGDPGRAFTGEEKEPRLPSLVFVLLPVVVGAAALKILGVV